MEDSEWEPQYKQSKKAIHVMYFIGTILINVDWYGEGKVDEREGEKFKSKPKKKDEWDSEFLYQPDTNKGCVSPHHNGWTIYYRF